MSEKLLYVGLDHDDRHQNLELAGQLTESRVEGNFGFKINLDHVLMWGERYIEEIVDTDKDVFVDLKMNNGPRTMSNVIRWLGELGVAHTNVWAHSESNLADTLRNLESAADIPDILGVTFYSRWNEAYAQKHHGIPLPDLIKHWAYTVIENGADGIILPANHLDTVNELDVVKLSPAIRISEEATASKQAQVNTPYNAIMSGADILVVGSPIYTAAYPVEALRTYLGEIGRAEAELASQYND